MGDLSLKCPLCCNQTFDSKLSLIEHLANILTNLTCPICDNKWSSLAHLIEHLNLDDCQSQHNPIKTFDETEDNLIEKSLSQNKHNDIGKHINLIQCVKLNKNITYLIINNNYLQKIILGMLNLKMIHLIVKIHLKTVKCNLKLVT